LGPLEGSNPNPFTSFIKMDEVQRNSNTERIYEFLKKANDMDNV
jgi:hypothetical protein